MMKLPPVNTTVADDAAHPRLPPALTVEMSRLYQEGFSLIPLGGDDGKRPKMTFRDRKRFPLSAVVDRMVGAGSKTYGIRLKDLLVVDVDTDTPEARAYVQQHFGTSPARTRTKRGFHLWFRHTGKKPKAIRLNGISIDFKAGENEFVVGPQSERPDGAIYWPEGRLTTRGDLPRFSQVDHTSDDIPEQKVGRVPVGSRNDVLKAHATQLARHAPDFETLLSDLLIFRDKKFDDPAGFPEAQVFGLATWAWTLRQEGRLWGGESSVVILVRSAVNALVANRKHLALSLFVFLRGQHGHDPKAVFAIDPRALRREGLFKDGVNQLYAAIRTLIAFKFLILVRPARGKRNHNEYRLAPGKKEGEQGERAYSYISVQNSDPRNPDVEAA